MTAEDWSEPFAHAVAIAAPSGRFILLVNAWWEPLTFRLPTGLGGESLSVLIDTACDGAAARELGPVDDIVVAGRSLMLRDRSSLQP
jgi:pullulanase/glycogen debranching enzyme